MLRKLSFWAGLVAGIVVVFAVHPWSGTAMAQCGPWADVEVIPSHPTSADNITLVLSGVWCDSCTPKSPQVQILGSDIIVRTTNKDPVCIYAVTPWKLRVPVGKLAPGRYGVLVVHNGQLIGGLDVLEVSGEGGGGGAPGPSLLVTARKFTLPPASLPGVLVFYTVRDPQGHVSVGIELTPFTLTCPVGSTVTLNAAGTHGVFKLYAWVVGTTHPSYHPNPLTLILDQTTERADAMYMEDPEKLCSEKYRGVVGPWDKCGNDVGYSVPGPAGGDQHCLVSDCCSWYQVSHVHDLGKDVINCHLILAYVPGFADGCTGVLTVDISQDNQAWQTVYTSPTTTVDLDPPRQIWGMYLVTIDIPRMTPFRYVRVTVSNCYVDYSAVWVCCD